MEKQIIIEGSAIGDIATFYDEINRVFMGTETWKLGNSLDAFSDLLYGGYGAIKGDEPVVLLWLDMERSRDVLGYEATKAYYLDKLKPDSVYDKKLFQEKLSALDNGTGETYFEVLQAIISEHPNIELLAG